ncbi:MAG: prolyl oligopeptidase family serine peptidase [Myxococcales bacterium]|nr:prolyl oligopeptidase family serine peptidase [Myxococcales bacterium]
MRRTSWGWLAVLALSACEGGSTDVDAGATVRDGGSGHEIDAGPHDAGMPPPDDAGSIPSDAGASDGGADAGPPTLSVDDRLAELEAASADAAALDAVLHDVAWHEGWPMTDGTRWLFATRWDDAPPAVGLVSDVNDWTSATATRSASGTHFWVVIDEASFVTPAAGAKYKWLGGTDVYRAPPEARAYGFDAFGEHGYVAPPTAERWRERFDAFRSAHLDAPRAFRALLPAGFHRGDAARVLLMHDGQNVFHPDAFYGGWQVDEAVSAPGYEDVVVLAVDNAPDRFDAYTQVPDRISAGGGRVGGRADDYERLLLEEALPFFREQYGLTAARDDLVIAGSSLGGLVTLHLALRHGDAFRCGIAMSSTLGWGAFDAALDGSDALVRQWSTHGTTALYLDSGGSGTCYDLDGDGVDEDSDDSDNYCTTLQLRDRLVALGYAHETDLFHWHEAGASHNEAAWAARMPRALEACVGAGWTR